MPKHLPPRRLMGADGIFRWQVTLLRDSTNEGKRPVATCISTCVILAFGFQFSAVDDGELRVVEARRQIRSAKLSVESVDFSRGDGGAFSPSRRIVYNLSLDNTRRRTIQSAGQILGDGSFAEFSRQDALLLDGRIYRRDYDLTNPLALIAMPVVSIDNAATWLDAQYLIFDPRLFGRVRSVQSHGLCSICEWHIMILAGSSA
jgi:hypothetical protein